MTEPIDETDDIDEITGDLGDSHGQPSLETLVLMINTQRVKEIEEKTRIEFKELQERQEKVRVLHKILKAINSACEEDGSLDISDNQDLQDLLKEGEDLGVDIPKDKTKFSRQEKERLVENFQMTTEDYNMQNEMQLQTITRLTNERYESYQLARTIFRPLHEAKVNNARGAAGR